MAVALPPPSGKKLAKPCTSEPKSSMVDGHPCCSHGIAYCWPSSRRGSNPAGEHERGRQSGQVVGQQGRHPRVGRVEPRAVEVLRPEPVKITLGQEEPEANNVSRPRLAAVVGDGIDAGAAAQVARAPRRARAARPARRGCRPRCRRRPPRGRRRRRARRRARAPTETREGIVGAGGRLVLGRQSVVDRQHVHPPSRQICRHRSSWVSRCRSTWPPPW